jgi:N-acylglucosamine-6-phosphate 2-epimerase
MRANNPLEGLIISCQPDTGDEPFYDYEFIKRFALAAEYGGASAVRIEGVENIRELGKVISIPIIGLLKSNPINSLTKRNITSRFENIRDLFNAGARIIAVDFTFREKKNTMYYSNLMQKVKQNFNVDIMADISTIEEALNAEKCGVSYLSTTLTGYTEQTRGLDIPNFDILKELYNHVNIPFFAEGGFSTEEDIRKAILHKVSGIVMGTAITRPHVLVSKISKIIK